MKIAFIDSIQEKEVCVSLKKRLEALGHDVKWFETSWTQHKLINKSDSKTVREIIRWKPDALLNFRVSNLGNEELAKLKKAGIYTLAWFSDDPVLYRHVYSKVFSSYSLVLHCGSLEVIDFYFKRHGFCGVNFPFWASEDDFSFNENTNNIKRPIFLGNCEGRIKEGRKKILKGIPNIKILGRCDEPTLNSDICTSISSIDDSLNEASIGINIPQDFKDYIGTKHYFSGLETLGKFEVPSRVVQYMAKGIPIFSFPSAGIQKLIPEIIVDDCFSEVSGYTSEELKNRGRKLRERYLKDFSASSRAKFLIHLIENQIVSSTYSPGAAHTYFKVYEHEPLTKIEDISEKVDFMESENFIKEKEKVLKELAEKKITAKKAYRIIHIGTGVNGSTDIVTSLKRGLEKLGHDVLDLDTRRHSQLVINNNNLQGGHGPIYINYDAIKSIIEQFDPQIIICNAGGLCFNEIDAEKVKEAGILLIGITLSDPDVMPSVMSYASSFDIHTTNAIYSLEKYISSGITNTVYLPFAIDREYVLEEVEKDVSYEADVICIGHATNRPERNELMQELAQHFDVKVYGKGWNLPGAKVVEGVEMLKASRAGKVHINFANTRAGYINIKCGVFETIGSGGLLCTAPFKEMENFFEYGKEIVGYKDASDLIPRLKELFKDNSIDVIRLNALKKLVTQHLYEHRWLELFETIEKDLAGRHELIPADRAKSIKEKLEPIKAIEKSILLYGFYGAKNLGDELILKSIAQNIRNRRPEYKVVAASQNPLYTMQTHGISAISRLSLNEIHEAVVRSDHIILGGGGLWHDYTFERSGGILGVFNKPEISIFGYGRPLIIANMYQVPASVHGMGVGPLANQSARRAIRYIAKDLEHINVRDQYSKELLIECGLSGIRTSPDVVYALDMPKIKDGAEPSYILVNLRKWPTLDEKKLEKLAEYCNALSAKHGYKILLIPIQSGNSHDESVLRSFQHYLKTPSEIFNDEINLTSIVEVLNQAAIVISMRLHFCLLAHRNNVPCIGLSYDEKVEKHFKEIGSRSWLKLENIHSIDNFEYESVISERNVIAKNLKTIERESKDGFEPLIENIDKHAKPNDTPSLVKFVPFGNPKKAIIKGQANTLVGGEILDIATVSSSNEHKVSYNEKWLEFYLNKRDPAKGEYASLRMNLKGSNQFIALSLTSPYSRPKNKGRMVYQVYINGILVVSEDVAYYKGENLITTYCPKVIKTVEIRVMALVDCEDWGWGKAASIRVNKIEFFDTAPIVTRKRSLQARCSSPYSKIHCKKFK